MTRGEWLTLFLFALLVSLVGQFAIVNLWWPLVGTLVVALLGAAIVFWWRERNSALPTAPG